MRSASPRRESRGRARRSGDRRSLAPAVRTPMIDDVDRIEFADFLRRRREALRPDDVGLPPGQRRPQRTRAQVLLVFTATPGTEDAEKLQLLSVVGPELL